MSGKLNLVTGATGLLGSHIAEQLVVRGERVRALVRPSGDTTFLRRIGAELAEGDLGDANSVRRAVAGADVVYHSAARVGDWGPWRAFQEQVLDATAHLLDACRAEKVGRVLHVSSITVYGQPDHERLITEDEPPAGKPGSWEYYRRAKLAAEELCRAYPGPLTIVRPGWMYGPRDRITFPRVVAALRLGRVGIIGTGDNLLNLIYAGDVADGAIRAADREQAVGRAYNFCGEGEVTQRQLIDALTDALGLPRVRRRYPFRVAYGIGLFAEVVARLIRLRRPPHISRYAVALVGRSTRYSVARARKELGWEPKVGIEEGLRRTLEWFREKEAAQTQALV